MLQNKIHVFEQLVYGARAFWFNISPFYSKDLPIHIDAISMGMSIVFFKGP